MRLVLEAPGLPKRQGVRLLPPVPGGRIEKPEEEQGLGCHIKHVNANKRFNM